MSRWNLIFISEKIDLPYTLVGEFNQGEKLYLQVSVFNGLCINGQL